VNIGECIFVNDGGPNDFKMLIEYIKNSSQLTIIELDTKCCGGPKSGAAKARNLGILYAKFEYLAFLDCDDKWKPNCLKGKIELIAKDSMCKFAYSCWEYITEDGKYISKYIIPQKTTYKELILSNYLALPSVVIKRSELGSLRFEDIGHEDYDLWLKLLQPVNAYAKGVPEIGLSVRRARHSLSSNKLEALKWHWKILKKQKNLSPIQKILYFQIYIINAIAKRYFKIDQPLFLWVGKII
jgi:glycosyltransferase involved in cell wall biosynthesis